MFIVIIPSDEFQLYTNSGNIVGISCAGKQLHIPDY